MRLKCMHDAYTSIDTAAEPWYTSSRSPPSYTPLEPKATRQGYTHLEVFSTEKGHVLTVSSSLLVKLPLSVQVPCTKSYHRAMLSKGIQRAHPIPIPSNCPKNVACANCTMRNSKTPPKRVRFTPFPVSMVSRTFWTLFLLSFPSLPRFPFGVLRGAPRWLWGKHSTYEQNKIAEMQLAERSHWRLYALAVRS